MGAEANALRRLDGVAGVIVEGTDLVLQLRGARREKAEGCTATSGSRSAAG